MNPDERLDHAANSKYHGELHPAEIYCKKGEQALYALNLYFDLPPALLWHISGASATGVYFFLYRFFFFIQGRFALLNLKKNRCWVNSKRGRCIFLPPIEQEAAMAIHHMQVVES